jgi:Tfp pilus assembly protein PilV
MTTTSKAAATAEGGFSLVEVLVAACVLAGAVAALLHVFIFATGAHADAHSVTVAAILATQKMEELRATESPSELTDAVDYADARGVVLADGVAAPRFYERRWTIQPSSIVTGALLVTVTVARSQVRGAGTVRLITLRSRPGSPLPPEGE